MMIRGPVALAITLAAVLLASGVTVSVGAPSSGGGTLLEKGTPAPATSVTTDIVPIPAGVAVRPLPDASRVPITVTLAGRNSAELDQYLAEVQDPASPEYHQFLSEASFVDQFAPAPSAVRSVDSTLVAAGAGPVTIYPDGSAITADVPAASVRALFGVRLVAYGTAASGLRYTATGGIHLAPSIVGLVTGVSGLSGGPGAAIGTNLEHSQLRPVRSARASADFVNYTAGPSEWFVGSDFTQVFGATRLFPGPGSVAGATFPKKVAIATLLASGYNATINGGENLPAYDPTVVQAYFNGTFPNTWPMPNVSGVPLTIDGITPPMPGSFGAVNDSTPYEFENSLDLEMAGSLAPGASVVNFYFAGSLAVNASSYTELANDFAFSLSSALAHNYSPARLAVVSGSFGLPDLNASEWNFETQEAAATGVSIVIASGDQGNAPDSLTGRGTGPWPTWPGTSAFNTSGAIAVGGVSLAIGGRATANYNGTGALNLTYDSNLTAITNLSAWYDVDDGVAGTEGGVSTVVPEPYWQDHSAAQPAIYNATLRQGASFIGRAEPDLALPANDTVATVWANSTEAVYFTVLEGTSIAAPVFAGILADLVAVESNQSASGWSPLGFFAPTIYRISSFYAANPSTADPFTAVTAGANYVFSAEPGWDPLTGWGTVDASRLLVAVENGTIANYTYTGPTPQLPPSSGGSSSPFYVGSELYIILGVATLAALLVVVFATRPRRAPAPGPSIPPGAQGAAPTGATFLCPYCGAVRPAEPVRCPQCGAY